MYDILIKGGHVIDPKNGVDGRMDVGISGRSVAAVQDRIADSQGRRIVDAHDCYVTPGLVDLHAHCYGFDGAMFPDEMCFPYGVTTMVDCGGAGWRTFDDFNQTVIRKAGPRVFAFLNIVGEGMRGDVEQNIDDMEVEPTAAKIRQRSDVLIGVKVAHFGGVGWGVGRSRRCRGCRIGHLLPRRSERQGFTTVLGDDAATHEPRRRRYALLRLREADDRQRRQG